MYYGIKTPVFIQTRLIGDNADRPSPQTSKADHYVGRKLFVNFKETPLVDNPVDHIFDIVRLIRILRHDTIEIVIFPISGITGWNKRWIFAVVLGHIFQ